MFFVYEGMMEGALEGHKPYFAIESVALTQKFRGRPATRIAIDAHNC